MKSGKITGALLALAGVFCLSYPIATSISVDIVIGACFFVGAIFALFQSPQMKGGWDRALYFVMAVLYALGGFFMMANPVEGTLVLTVAIGAIFVVQSAFLFLYWKRSRSRGPASGITLLNAAATGILGILILANIASGFWFIGVLVGINLIFTGIFTFLKPGPETEG